MHKLLVYNHAYDETFFINRFVQGLKPSIRAPVKLQQPTSVDIAYSLAQTQEALLAEDTSKYSKKWEPRFSSKPYIHQGLMGSSPADKRPEEQPRVSDKVDNLRAQHRARGECFKCGETYGPGHKCPSKVQLHVMEELWDAMQSQDSAVSDSDSEHQPTEPTDKESDDCMKLSVQAATGTSSKESIKLQGMVGKRQLLILVDSGSSTNFIRADLAKELKCSTEDIPASTVTVANGGTLPCTTQVPNLQWFCQGQTFNTQLKVLPLGTYDIILGM